MSDSEIKIPSSIETETLVIATIMDNAEVYLNQAKGEGLALEHFYNDGLRGIYKIILDLGAKEEPMEFVTIMGLALKSNISEKFGGLGELAGLGHVGQIGSNLAHHVETLRNLHAARVAIRETKKLLVRASTSRDPHLLVSGAESIASDLRLITAPRKAFLNSSQSFNKFISRLTERFGDENAAGIPTGIIQIDDNFGGLRAGELWVICGATSGGKSALSLQILIPAIIAMKNVLIFTLEMTADEIVARMISCKKQVSMSVITKPKGATRTALENIKAGSKFFNQTEMKICDEANISIDYICSASEEASHDKPVDVILVDYIQLVESRNAGGDNREQQLNSIAKRLKQLAKKLNCAVITPAQLNDDGRLRESRAIGQTADNVLRILPNGVVVDKARNGKRDEFYPLLLDGEFQTFRYQPEPNPRKKRY